jgi:hypothetical protein
MPADFNSRFFLVVLGFLRVLRVLCGERVVALAV